MMEKYNLDRVNPIDEEINAKIWSIFNIIRNDGLGLDTSYIILLLISLYKDNAISEDFLFNNKEAGLDDFTRILHISDEEMWNNHDSDKMLDNYKSIIQIMGPSLSNISKRASKEIINLIYQIDRGILSENFSSIFDSTLNKLTQSQGRHSGEHIQPFELTRLMTSIAKPYNARVFNPFAGLASFGINLDGSNKYFGQEINKSTWALGTLRLMAYGKYPESKSPFNDTMLFDNNDSLFYWTEFKEKFDLIISTPPFGVRLDRHYRDSYPNIRTIEQFLLEKGVQSLSDNGKLVTLMSQGILFRGGYEEKLRKHLVENDLIDIVISLPGGLMYNTGIPLVVLVLNNNKSMPGKVRFVDAKEFVSSTNRKEKKLDDFALYEVIKNHSINDDTVRVVSNDEIVDLNYNLSVQRYFQKKVEGVKLGEILEFVRGQRASKEESGKLIRIKDLKEDKLEFNLDVSNVENSEFRRPDVHKLNESCLLLAIRFKTLKPTYFDYKEESIYRNNDILSFKVDGDVADISFLINELHADYVQEQIESYRAGSAIPYIRKDDLMEVVIKLPSIEEQRAKAKGIAELSLQIKTLQEERNAIAHGVKSTQFNEFASLKHSIGAPRQNILSNSKSLIRFFENNQSESFVEVNKVFEQKYAIGLIDVFKEIKEDINHISNILEKGENGLILEDYPKTSIPLRQINSFINELSENGYNFHLQKNLITDNHIDDNAIECNITLLRVLFDNILKNAHKYGFIENKSLNEVVIDLQVVDSTLEVGVKNNGMPFPNNFNKEKFISKFSTADTTKGTGIGGYDINRIAEYFGDSNWILNLEPAGIYPVIFKFSFDIKLLK